MTCVYGRFVGGLTFKRQCSTKEIAPPQPLLQPTPLHPTPNTHPPRYTMCRKAKRLPGYFKHAHLQYLCFLLMYVIVEQMSFDE